MKSDIFTKIKATHMEKVGRSSFELSKSLWPHAVRSPVGVETASQHDLLLLVC